MNVTTTRLSEREMWAVIVFLLFATCSHPIISQALVYPAQPMAVITTGNVKSNPQVRTINSNADYSRKVNVRVSDILTRQQAAEAANFGFRSSVSSSVVNVEKLKEPDLPRAEIVVRPPQTAPQSTNALVVPMAKRHEVIRDDRSWPPEHSQEFARVDVRVMGQKLDTKALLHLTPSSDPNSVKKLRKILGSDLQSDWMSIEAPPKTQSGKSTRSLSSDQPPKPDESLLTAVENLNFTIYRPTESSDVLVPVQLSIEQVGLLKDWLLQRATCKVDYIWEDLGSLFWPRWIKRGICVNSISCSWPPGMRCRPNGSRTLKLLRWACSDESRQKRHARKRWLRNAQGRMRRRSRRDGPMNGSNRRISREERRSRRVRRLIRRLSLTANGYHCEWNPHEFMVTDSCSCGCE